MPALDAPSPTPSAMPPPAGTATSSSLKRPRQSAAGTASATGASQPRPKRRKPEEPQGSVGPEERDARGRPVNFGVGMVKGREDEWDGEKDVVTKIDFNKLPVETLYRYLELHDLLPRWDISPWSEEPCIPPNALYASAPLPPTVPIVPSPKVGESTLGSPSGLQRPMDLDPIAPTDNTLPPDAAAAPPLSDPSVANGNITDNVVVPNTDAPDADAQAPNPEWTGEGGVPGPDDVDYAAPTTRSKTAPARKPPTPPPTSPPPREIKRGVMTLSDVMAARGVLAEKANAHWVKGLGGGQNKEGETIVNFLYKMKVGPGRLLRVYNPTPATYP